MRKSPEKIAFARKLRREQTDAERMPWSRLRAKQIDGVKFRRQHPIGPYIVDFLASSRKLIVELDGGQHNEPEMKERDYDREKYLTARGYHILRFWNNEILMNPDGVLAVIKEALRTQRQHHPHLASPCKGEEWNQG